MASPISWITDASANDDDSIREIGGMLQQTFADVEQALSRFRADSELSRMNARLGVPARVSPVFYQAASLAERAWRRTGGVFDPRVIRDLTRMGYAGAQAGWSQPESPARRWILRDPYARAVTLNEPIDFGGIGKSIAIHRGVRRALAVWDQRIGSPPSFILNAGGDLAVVGPGPDQKGWSIGIEDPYQPDHLLATILVFGPMGVCTSSTVRRRWQWQGQSVHHLIDPRTHQPGGEGLASVTVARRSPIWAEVWSKTLLLSGARRIARDAARLGDAVWWVTVDGRLHMTPAAEGRTTWVAPQCR